MNLLAQMTWGQWFLAAMLIGVCAFLMIVILLQRGRGGGLAGAFGGAGGSAAFGAKTGDVFTWITVVVATVFVLLAVVANFAFDQSPGSVGEPATETAGTDVEIPLEGEGTGVPAAVPTMPIEPENSEITPTGGQDDAADAPVDEGPGSPEDAGTNPG